ncbi:MAG: T9SS type A sorting domain-containing protein, partial [Bacteroidota bacterium]
TLLITDALVDPNEEFCLPILVQNMTPLTGLQFEVLWEEEKLEYQSIDLGENVLGLGSSSLPYNASNNSFKFAWFDLNSQNVQFEQTTPLFSLCFKALGTQGEQTPVSFGTDLALEATTMIDNVPIAIDVAVEGGIVFFRGNENAVLPGDSDLNEEVNHYDLINIGIGYGQTGPIRENATLDFIPQAADDWAASTPITNINYKHADTNGDGIINSEDTEAIDLNWTNTPTLVNTAFTEEGIPFYVDAGILRLLETNQLPIILGTETQMAEKIYSIAFSIYYESEMMLNDGLMVTLENSWLGDSEELISVQRFFPEEKRIDMAISRIDQQGVTGFGEIGALNIVMEDVILFQNEREVKFTIDHVEAIGEVQTKPMGISTRPSFAQIQQGTTATYNLLDQSIFIYPNPATTEIILSSDKLYIEGVELRNLLGRRVSIIYSNNRINLESLPPGSYFLTIHTNKGTITKKINIQ